jgi:Diadenosine tetraphosphate (Ap4A) hydrolase and other HIT family hydrolases
LENNLLKTPILHKSNGGFLVPALGSEGNYLIVPKVHAEDPGELPDDWWADFKALFAKVPIEKAHYNLSLNVGEHAGQTVKHLHFWVIPRKPGLPTSGKGLAALIQSSSIE